ncbi:MAG: hypothetical protein J7521_12795 [Caulobacter sp.]|nr:hypothetical protein [Caulobacter sp.]
MNWQGFDSWLTHTGIGWIALLLFAAMCLAAVVGALILRLTRAGKAADGDKDDDNGQGYIVSAVLGLLALLMGFTFSLAIDRFDARRLLVIEEANAIGTAYLRAQLLTEPHRARMTDLLVRYTDTRIALAKARPASAEQNRLLRTNDALLTDIWAATSASFDSIKGLDFSSTYIDSINTLIDLDASRKAARGARVPTEVFAVLFIYLVTTAGVLGYVLTGVRGRLASLHLFALLTLSLVLIIDINRPVLGGVTESQRPMEDLRKSLAAQPPAVFDKWHEPAGS